MRTLVTKLGLTSLLLPLVLASCTTTKAANVTIPLQARFRLPGDTVALIGIKDMGGDTARAAGTIEGSIRKGLQTSGKTVVNVDADLQERIFSEIERGVFQPELLSENRVEAGQLEQPEAFIVGSITSFTFDDNTEETSREVQPIYDFQGNPTGGTREVIFYSGSAFCSLEGQVQAVEVASGRVLETFNLRDFVSPWSESITNQEKPNWNKAQIQQSLLDTVVKQVDNFFGSQDQRRSLPFWVSGPPTLPFQHGVEDAPNGMALMASGVPEFEQALRALNINEKGSAWDLLDGYRNNKEAEASNGMLARLYYNMGLVAHYNLQFETAREYYKKCLLLESLPEAQKELDRVNDDEARLDIPTP